MDFARKRIAEWLVRAAERRSEGAEPTAQLYEKVAGELQSDLERFETEELSLVEAMEYSGYSEDRLRVLRKEGKTTWTRRDLPKKPGGKSVLPAVVVGEGPTLVDRVLQNAQLVGRRRGRRMNG
jgi:hypothetical protein